MSFEFVRITAAQRAPREDSDMRPAPEAASIASVVYTVVRVYAVISTDRLDTSLCVRSSRLEFGQRRDTEGTHEEIAGVRDRSLIQ